MSLCPPFLVLFFLAEVGGGEGGYIDLGTYPLLLIMVASAFFRSMHGCSVTVAPETFQNFTTLLFRPGLDTTVTDTGTSIYPVSDSPSEVLWHYTLRGNYTRTGYVRDLLYI